MEQSCLINAQEHVNKKIANQVRNNDALITHNS
jgi:hypothetical protein